MGWGYRKRLTLLPGVRINLSKRGVSATIGPRGASINIGKDGVYQNLGVPGSGLYSRRKLSGRGGNSAAPTPDGAAGEDEATAEEYEAPIDEAPVEDPDEAYRLPEWVAPVLALAALVLLLFLGSRILFAASASPPATPPVGSSARSAQAAASASPLLAAPAAIERYVTAVTLNCRAAGRASAPVVKTLRRGQSIMVEPYSPGAEWARETSEAACWVAVLYLAATPPAPPAVRSRAVPLRSRSSAGAGSCPCSSGRICVGPRGGRYCITSGGNKRYGV